MPSRLVRPLCRAGAAPSGRESARAPFDGSKPGLAPGTVTGGPAATRAGVCAAGFLARCATPAPRRRDGRWCGPHTMAQSLGSHLAPTPGGGGGATAGGPNRGPCPPCHTGPLGARAAPGVQAAACSRPGPPDRWARTLLLTGALARRATPGPRRRDGRRCGPHTMGSHLALTPAALQPHRSPRIRFHFDHASHTGQPRPRGGTDVCVLGTEMRERYCPQRAEGERGGDLPPPGGGNRTPAGGGRLTSSPQRGYVRVEPRGSSRVEHIN
jgi:hypothetical protein